MKQTASYKSCIKCLILIVSLFCLLVLPPGLSAQNENSSKNQTNSDKYKPKNKPEKLEVSVERLDDNSQQFTIRAENGDVGILARQLSKELSVPFVLSPLVQSQKINLDIESFPLEMALREIAPHPRIDYIISQKAKGVPQPAAIYLSGYNEKEPLIEKSLQNKSMAIVFEGDTESTETDSPDRYLKVSIDENGKLNVSARRQSVSYILSEIAQAAGLNFDLRYDSDELIDIEIRNESLPEALTRVSPFVTVYLRKDLLTGNTSILKVALVKN